MSEKGKMLVDKEVAGILGISTATLSRAANGRFLKGGIDLRKAEPIKIGASRRWPSWKLANLLGLEEEKIVKMARG